MAAAADRVAIFTVFTTWQRGRKPVTARREAAEGPLRAFIDDLHEQRVPDTAVFLNRARATAPLAMRSNVRHNHVLHERVVIVAVETVPVPVVDPRSSRLWTIWVIPTTESRM
jgi:KUP system potassium uptake protein